MKLSAQWLWVAALPIVLILLVDGYVGKLKVGSLEFEAGIRQLKIVPPQRDSQPVLDRVAAADVAPGTSDSSSIVWPEELEAEYKRTRRFFLVHVFRKSEEPGQLYDVAVFLLRHVPGRAPNQRDKFEDVQQAEFCFGPSWNNNVFVAPNDGGFVGVRTSAWGTFLATCKLTFRDGTSVVLHRYVDFEMAPRRA